MSQQLNNNLSSIKKNIFTVEFNSRQWCIHFHGWVKIVDSLISIVDIVLCANTNNNILGLNYMLLSCKYYLVLHTFNLLCE